VTFRPRQGLFWLIFGFPIFGALAFVAESFDEDPDYGPRLIWAAGMASTFALLATFTKWISK
jgi:hypothetical protein